MKSLDEYEYLYGLIGKTLTHSFSKKYFTEKFKKEGISNSYYELFPLKDIAELPSLIVSHSNLKGINVTIPYKEAVIPYLDVLDHTAKAVGAVNTIQIEKGKLIGYNTDVYGFGQSLRHLFENKSIPSKALILGTGGASKAVAYVLESLNIDFRLVSRTPHPDRFTYTMLSKDILEAYPLIINTTPLGTYPKVEEMPRINYSYLSTRNCLFDLIYNPKKTVFLQNGLDQGCLTQNGLEMLILQAEKAWEIWTN